jgi:hypothetical protein
MKLESAVLPQRAVVILEVVCLAAIQHTDFFFLRRNFLHFRLSLRGDPESISQGSHFGVWWLRHKRALWSRHRGAKNPVQKTLD